MIIADFDGLCVFAIPRETNAELIIDADGVLAETVTLESLQSISGWDSKVIEGNRFVELDEFSQGGTDDLGEFS